jgi:16S rRNA G527 N7-methylase RsmG
LSIVHVIFNAWAVSSPRSIPSPNLFPFEGSWMTMTPQLPEYLMPFCQAFLKLLDRWNRRHALTGLAPGLRREELLLDSAVLLPWLLDLAPGSRVVDFGTGMGIPALLLAVARPDLPVFAVDRSRKKLAFVRQAALELGLPNLVISEGDAAKLPPLEATLGVAKAVGSLPLLLGWWERHGILGTPLLALKGPEWRENPLQSGWILRPHFYRLPTRGERVIVEARKMGAHGRP